MLRPLAVLGTILLAITILFQLASTNMGFSLVRLVPKFERLNPVAKLKDLPGRNLGSFVQAAVMIPVMFWLTWSLVRDRLPDLLRLPLLPVSSAAAIAPGTAGEGRDAEGVLRACAAGVIFMLIRGAHTLTASACA